MATKADLEATLAEKDATIEALNKQLLDTNRSTAVLDDITIEQVQVQGEPGQPKKPVHIVLGFRGGNKRFIYPVR